MNLLELKEKLEKIDRLEKNYPVTYNSSIFFAAQDHYYLGDLDDEALGHLYELIHIDYEKRNSLSATNRDPNYEIEALKAELMMIREFKFRKVTPPKIDDTLTRSFLSLSNRIRKAEEKAYKATTQPDTLDEHIHEINKLSKTGDGVTEEAGDPSHTHNVTDFLVSPVDIEGYKSDHPGKIDVKVGKSAFKVIKRDEDGTIHWEADFNIINKNEDQHLVCGIIYEPDIMDAQGDSAGPEEIQKACHNYMIKSQTVGLMHERRIKKNEVALVENFIAPVSYLEGGQMVYKGSWVQVHKVISNNLWDDVKKGKYTGYSMGGKARDANRELNKRAPAPASKLQKYAEILKTEVKKYIRPCGSKYCVYSEDGKKLGSHPTREKAFAQLQAIEANKHLTAKHLTEDNFVKAEHEYITQERMKSICSRCSKLMKRKHITRVQLGTLMNKSKFKRMFGIRRSSIGHDGPCRKYCADPKLFAEKARGE